MITDKRSAKNNEDADNKPFHHLARPDGHKYPEDKVRQVQVLYILAAILWVLLVFLCQWYITGVIGWVFLLIPLVVFFINYYYAYTHTIELENRMFQGNYLSFAFLIAVILINWSKVSDKRRIFKIIMVSLFFLVLSLIDIWTSPENQILITHIRTILQTVALVLLAYALYTFYIEIASQDDGSNKGEEVFENH